MRLVSVVFLIFLTSLVYAQTSLIRGKIIDHQSGTSLASVNVYLDKTEFGDATNSKGEFILTGIPEGEYKLIASSIGYFSISQNITVEAGAELSVDLSMVESITTLSEITIMTGGEAERKEITGSVHYVSPKEIQKFNYTDVSRVLKGIPGVNIQEEDGFGLRPNIGLRGTGVERSSKITLMEDGVLMAPAPYAAPAAYYFPTIGRMQAVEVLKGSSQIKYGPYTTGGAINLLSTPIPVEFGGRVSLLGSSFGGRNLHAFIGNAHENVAYMVETFQMGSEGFKNLPGNENTGFDKKDYLAKLRFNTSDGSRVYQSLLFKVGQVTEVSNETYLGLNSEDFQISPFSRYSASQNDQMNSEQSQFSVNHSAVLSPSFKLSTTAYRNTFHRNWYKLDKVVTGGEKFGLSGILDQPTDNPNGMDLLNGISSSPDDRLLLKANNRNYLAQGVETRANINLNSTNLDHNLLVGLRYHFDEIDRFQWVDGYSIESGIMSLEEKGQPGTESNRIESATAFAGFIQYTIRDENWLIKPGLRYESIHMERLDYGKVDPERTGSDLTTRKNNVEVFIPGISFEADITDAFNIIGGVHKGFAPPGSKEGTLPETSWNYELGGRFDNGRISGETIVYLNNYRNLLGTDLNASGGAGTGDLFNSGQVQTYGVEFLLAMDLLPYSESFRLPFSLSYTYTHSEFRSDFLSDFDAWGIVSQGDLFPYLAPHQLGADLSLEHLKYSINLRGRFTDRMRTSPGQGFGPEIDFTDRNMIWDISGSYKLHQAISLFGSINNVLNEVYIVARRPAGLRPGMPRSVNLGLRANF